MKEIYTKIIVIFILLIFLLQASTHIYAYENHCWRCKNDISSSKDIRCGICRWYICSNCSACMSGCERMQSDDTYYNHSENSTGNLIFTGIVISIILGVCIYQYLVVKKENEEIRICQESYRIREEQERLWKQKKKKIENQILIEQRRENFKNEKITMYENKVKNKEEREKLIKLLREELQSQNKYCEEIKTRIKIILEQNNYPINDELIDLIIKYYKINPLEEIEQLLNKNNYKKQINSSNNIVWINYKK